MIKTTYICDKCNTEMPAPTQESGKITLDYGGFGINIEVFAKTQMTERHLCNYCIVDLIVRKLDDRPKLKPEY